MIKSKDIRGVDRDAFFVEFIKFGKPKLEYFCRTNLKYIFLLFLDTHQKQVGDLTVILGYLQRALDSFWKEMKAQGNFDNVVMVCISDFARTLSPNSSDGTGKSGDLIQYKYPLRLSLFIIQIMLGAGIIS